MSMNKGF